jgi:hypothetical protein
MGRHVAEQMQGMGRDPDVLRSALDRALAQSSRLVGSTEQEAGAPQRVKCPAEIPDDAAVA